MSRMKKKNEGKNREGRKSGEERVMRRKKKDGERR